MVQNSKKQQFHCIWLGYRHRKRAIRTAVILNPECDDNVFEAFGSRGLWVLKVNVISLSYSSGFSFSVHMCCSHSWFINCAPTFAMFSIGFQICFNSAQLYPFHYTFNTEIRIYLFMTLHINLLN